MKKLLYLVYFIIIAILFSLGFYRNQWNAVAMEDVLYRREISETYIMGRLVKSHQDGIFSAGGLLGMGDVTEGNYNSSTIKNQNRKYEKGAGFSQYWLYKSQSGFQGIAYSILDSWTDFAPSTNLFLFRSAISIALALVLGGVCLWFLLEFGWVASLSAAVYILLSSRLAVFGGNLFWSLWSFYFPLLILALILRKGQGNREFALTFRFTLLVFVFSLVKILFSGFEFITTALWMSTVPIIYYAVLQGWERKTILRILVNTGAGLVASVMVGLLILATQIKMAVRNYKDAFAHIVFAFRDRTYQNSLDEASGSVQAETLRGTLEKIFDAVGHNLNGYAFSLSNRYPVNSDLVKDILDGRYLFLIALFTIATGLVFITHTYLRKDDKNRIGLALMAACWYSALAPLSWFVMFRDHALAHRSLDYLVWEMPFTLFGAALVGYAVSTVIRAGTQ